MHLSELSSASEELKGGVSALSFERAVWKETPPEGSDKGHWGKADHDTGR